MINDKITEIYMNTWSHIERYCTFLFLFSLTFIFYIFKNKGRKTKHRSTLILVCNDIIDIAAKSFLKFAEESRIKNPAHI